MDADEYDISPAYKEVKLSGQPYRIYEASEAVSMRYRQAMQKGVTFGPDGKPQSMPEGMAESESEFLAGCIYRMDDKGKEQKVLLQEVRAWPRRVVAQLFDIASNLSSLGKKLADEDDAAKKPLSAGADISD